MSAERLREAARLMREAEPTMWRRVFDGWRHPTRGDWVFICVLLLVSAACGVIALVKEPTFALAAVGWLAFAVEMYLILGVSIPHQYRVEPSPPLVALGRSLPPSGHDALHHYESADYWLRVAEQPGRSTSATQAAAALSQAHASLGSLAVRLTPPVTHRNGRVS